MALLSSPIAYPPSSSPPVIPEKRKNHHLNPLPHPKRRPLGVEHGASNRGTLFRTLSLGASISELPNRLEHNGTTISKGGPFIDRDESNDDEKENEGASKIVEKNNDLSISRENSHGLVEIATGNNHDSESRSSLSILRAMTSSAKHVRIQKKRVASPVPYEQLAASRSITAPGRAKKSFYGIDIHALLDQTSQKPKQIRPESVPDNSSTLASLERPNVGPRLRQVRTMLWTEKYRARKFTDLVGDERTHRDVLRWFKGWDPVVFPDSTKAKIKPKYQNDESSRQHRKILLITGPPGLGKTTLTHVCARQAGYEVVEINASDERSRDVVKGRIRDCVGTETVKGVNTKEAGRMTRKAGRPVCVVVDEVDGVVGGSGSGGEGGFIKALIDLVMLDQKNTNAFSAASTNVAKSKKKTDRFRLLRPIVLICNDVYHPALRPLRSSTNAEIIHIRRPPLDKITARLKYVLEKEGIVCDNDGVRRLCEAAWGITKSRGDRHKSTGTGEADMRGILVVGEWAAAKMRALKEMDCLNRKWVEEHMIENLSHGCSEARGLGRGNAKEVVEKTFIECAGFPKEISVLGTEPFDKLEDRSSAGVSELAKRTGMDRLREMVDASGETDRIMTDCFATYPTRPWQDDMFLSKPTAAYEWLHFHDTLSSKVHVGQEWELAPYLSHSVLGFHDLFATSTKASWASDQKQWNDGNEEEPLPFSGPRADYTASETLKQHKAILQGLQSSLSISLHRSFKSPEDLSTDLLPHLMKMLTPDVKPVVVGGSGEQKGIVSVRKEGEREMLQRAVNVMGAVGVKFERVRVDLDQTGLSDYIYRMEP